jgi:hypothetical protein
MKLSLDALDRLMGCAYALQIDTAWRDRIMELQSEWIGYCTSDEHWDDIGWAIEMYREDEHSTHAEICSAALKGTIDPLHRRAIDLIRCGLADPGKKHAFDFGECLDRGIRPPDSHSKLLWSQSELAE